MYHGTLTWTKLILKFCYFPVNVPDTLSGKLRKENSFATLLINWNSNYHDQKPELIRRISDASEVTE